MELNQYAMIVALARLSGVTGTKEEVYKKFWDTYNEVLREPVERKPVEVFERPV